MMCYYLNVHFQGQRVKGDGADSACEDVNFMGCFVVLKVLELMFHYY